jgi:pimeloyl-ACP methyl ester carboxylesterase
VVNNGNGLTMHVLEAGFAGSEGKPCLLLLHGFPELAYSWRKLLLPLAEAGYHVVAPDQRGYGRTTGWDPDFDGDLASFRMLNLVKDALGLVYALGRQSVTAVVGHDFGSPVAAWCSLIRPDVFRSVALMSAPFAGPPEIVFQPSQKDPIHEQLAALARPRKHYQWYYSTHEANDNMLRCPQGLDAFLRAYYHHKSADWVGNRPFPLQGWTASELAKLPTYYVMDRDKGMAETVAPEMPPPEVVARCRWLTDEELRVYSGEYARTGFQGGLQWYRCGTGPRFSSEMAVFAKRTIDVPACFIAGARDWGVYQKPGAVEKMRTTACRRMLGFDLVPDAGHWVQQEQPEAVTRLLLRFLNKA